MLAAEHCPQRRPALASPSDHAKLVSVAQGGAALSPGPCRARTVAEERE